MAYTPYTTDSPAHRLANRRARWRVALLTGVCWAICLVPPALYVWWRFASSIPAAPLAVLPLSATAELRLVETFVGRDFVMTDDHFKRRIVWDGPRWRPGVQAWRATSGDAAWLIFSLVDKSAEGGFEHPKIERFEIFDLKGAVYVGDCRTFSLARFPHGLPPVGGPVFNSFPWHEQELHYRVVTENHDVRGVMQNPFLGRQPR